MSRFPIFSLITAHNCSKYKISGKTYGGTGNLNTHLKLKHPDRIPQEINPVPEKFVGHYNISVRPFSKTLKKMYFHKSATAKRWSIGLFCLISHFVNVP